MEVNKECCEEECCAKEEVNLEEIFAKYKYIAYWYNRDTKKKLIKGRELLILPHEED